MPADLLPFQQSILRICSEEGKFYGVGCLLKPDEAITCAHVVADALGYDHDIDFIPPGKVQINCPFTDDNTHSVTAQVKAWFPCGGHSLSDMALLQLDEPLTESIAIKLSYAVNLNGVRFQAWGGPEGHEIHLIDIEGIIGNPIGNGRYRLSISSDYKIEKGYSGAPVVDVATGQVLGLIAQEELDKNIPAGFLIPAAHWRQTSWFPEPNAGAALDPLKTWIESHYNRRRERQRIERFVDNYAGTQTDPMPFAGRAEWLQQLDQWLAQDQSRFLLLSGSAGRGKSALLLHWLARIISQQPALTLLFLPISIRFETSNELEGLRLLHAALCDYFADLVFSPHNKPDINDYRDRLFEGWERIANQPNQRYLLVIDGIDESANHWLLKEVLPRKLPANWHLLLSARHRPGETDGTTWLSDLGITGELLKLPPLTPSAIAEAIIQLGRPLDELAEQQAFVEQLYRLTDQGDPLLLTLWIGQIWQHREVAPQITIDKLRQLEPNFAGFYQIWLAEQQKIWQAQSIAIHSSDFNRLMQVLASAYGPLLLEDELVDLLKQISLPVSWDYIKLRDVLTTASRLVVGDGETQGFSLIHPRLNDYFQAELAKNAAHQRQVQEAYLNWGAAMVTRLNQDQLMPDSCPHYLLDHYTAHIAAAHLEPNSALENYWLPLLEGGWHQAWEAYEGAWNGFLSDLERVLEALRQYNQACYERGERRAMKLAMEVRGALIQASIYSLNLNLPAELVVLSVEAGLWSLPRAERIITQFEAEKQVDCFVKLAQIALPKDKGRLLHQALTAVGNIQEESVRFVELSILVESLVLASQLVGKPVLLQQALNIVGSIQDEEFRAGALTRLASQLIGEPVLLQQALTIVGGIQDEKFRAKALIILAPLLAAETHLLQQTLTAAGNIQGNWRVQVLIALVPLLTGETRQQVLQQALTVAENIHDETSSFLALVKLIPLLAGELHLLQQALTAAGNIQDNCRVQVLIALVPLLTGETRQQVLQQALTVAENIQNEYSRANALTELAPLLTGETRQRVLQQAVTVAETIQDEWSRAYALTELAPLLMGEPHLWQQTLTAMGNIQDEAAYTESLITQLIPNLTGKARQQILQQALIAVGNIQNEGYRTLTLRRLIHFLAGELYLLQQALVIAENIQNESNRDMVLTTLVFQLAAEPPLLQQALAVAKNIQEESKVLTALALQLVGKPRQQVLQQALIATINIQNGRDRARTLLQLAPLLEEESRQQVLQQALTVGNIHEEEGRTKILTKLAPLLVEKTTLRKDFLEIALAFSDREERIVVSTTLTQNNPDLLTYSLWADWLNHASLKRSELFEVTDKLCAAAIQLTGNLQEANEIARAVMDVAKWWP